MISQKQSQLRKVLRKYEKLGARRILKTAKNIKKEEELYLDLTSLWISRNNHQDKHQQAIRNTSILSEQRKMTFLRYNYRHSEQKGLDYSSAYHKIIGQQNTKNQFLQKPSKGTMNVTELWSQSNMQQVVGFPGFLNRLKILKMCTMKKFANKDMLRSTVRGAVKVL